MTGTETGDTKTNPLSVDATVSVAFPPFWHEMPALWFIQVEAVLAVKRVTSDTQQYLLTIAALPVDIIATISDIISKPPETGRFANLKKEVVKRLSLSEAQRLEKLIGTTAMGDLTPSAFYRRLTQLAGTSTAVTEELIKTLWLKRLPDQLRSIVLVQESEPIEKLTSLADKIWEFHAPSTSAICSNSKSTENPTTSNITLEKLAVAINELRQHVYNQDKSRSRDISRNRSNNNRSNPKVRPRSSSGQRRYCYYHFRFGAAAKKCRGGSCAYTGQSNKTAAHGQPEN